MRNMKIAGTARYQGATDVDCNFFSFDILVWCIAISGFLEYRLLWF